MKENKVELQRAEMRMVRWMCDVKVKHKSSTKQTAMVWACVAKRRHRLGKEMYGV